MTLLYDEALNLRLYTHSNTLIDENITMISLQAIAETVASLAAPGLKPKELIAALRKQHPEASKKEINRGAFLAMIQAADGDPDRARRVQEVGPSLTLRL